MKSGMFIVLAVLLMSFSDLSHAQEIGRLSLDDTASLGLIVEKDPAVKVEGQASLKIVTRLPTTVNLGELSPLDVQDTKIVYKAQVKTDGLQGSVYLEMWCFFGQNKYFSRGLHSVATGTSDWQTLSTPFSLMVGEKPDKIMLNLVINGQGTVWVDDVSVSKTDVRE